VVGYLGEGVALRLGPNVTACPRMFASWLAPGRPHLQSWVRSLRTWC